MIKVEAALSSRFKEIELFYLADWHLGSESFDEKAARKLISYIGEKPNRFCCLGGDMMDNATVGSVSDGFKATMPPEDQLDLLTEILEPIKDRILVAIEGNHEKRTYKTTGINLIRAMCATLGILDKYAGDAFVLFLSFGHGRTSKTSRNMGPSMFVIYGKHGSGGGATPGGKVNKVSKMSETIDCDIYLHAHTHMPGAFKTDTMRVNRSKKEITQHTQLFINTASLLNFGGYGERLGFKPSCKDVPLIQLIASPMRAMTAKV